MIIIKRKLKIKLISHSFIGGLICFFLFTCNLVVDSAWSETSTLSNNPISNEPEIEDVDSWGAFRGWSPAVPYGQKSLNPLNKQSSNINHHVEQENPIVMNNEKLNPASSVVNSSDEDSDESTGAFRGWSPSIPYGE